MAREGGLFGRIQEAASEAAKERLGVTVVDTQALDLLEATALDYSSLRKEMDILGWSVLDAMGDTQQEVNAPTRRKFAAQARAVWEADPQAGAAVDLLNDFVFGRGVPRPRAKDPKVQEVLDEAWDDEDNQLVLTSYSAQIAMGVDLAIQSNIFILMFDDGDDGKVKLGLLNHDEVEDAVRDPDNRLRVRYYVARQRRLEWDFDNDKAKLDLKDQKGIKTMYFAGWSTLDPEEQKGQKGPSAEKLGKGKVYHVAVNRRTEQVFGTPSMRRTIRWHSAFNDFMRARVDIVQASAAFIMKRKVKGTPTQVARIAAKAISRDSPLASSVTSSGQELALGSRNASTITENEGVSHEQFSLNSNAGNAAQDGQMLRSQISAATRFPQSFFGDATNSNLATATCHDAKTETLTSDGWLTLDELKARPDVLVAAYDSASDVVRYEKPKRMIVQGYEGPMLRFSGAKRTDMLVTPNHRMLVRRGDSLPTAKPFEFIQAGDLLPGSRYYAKAAARSVSGVRVETFVLPGVTVYHGNGRGLGVRVLREDRAISMSMDAFLDWLGWFIAEGSGGGDVTQSVDSRWLREIQEACRALGVPSIEKIKVIAGREHWCWKPRNPKAWLTWLEAQCGTGASNKRVPPFVFSLPAEQQMRVLRGMMRGDGGCGPVKNGWEVQGTSYYATTSEQLADDAQRLAFNCGFRAVRRDGSTYQTVRGSRTAYTVVLTAAAKSPSRGTSGDWVTLPKATQEHYEGEVYCFETSTGAFVTRRNGRVSIQGNSLELPVLKMVESRQEVFEQVFRWFLDRVVERAVETGRLDQSADPAPAPTDLGAGIPGAAPTGQFGPQDPSQLQAAYDGQSDGETLTERDLSYEFSLPSPLRRMMTDLVNSVSNIAKTFDPNATNLELSRTLLAVALGEGLEVSDPAAVVDRIFPPGYVDPAIAAAQAQAGQQSPFGPPDQAPPPDAGGGTGGPTDVANNPYSAPMQSQQPVGEAAVTRDRNGDPILWVDEQTFKQLPEDDRNAANTRRMELEREFDEDVASVVDQSLKGLLLAPSGQNGNGNHPKE